MAAIQKFEELEVWQTARKLVTEIYSASRIPAFSKDLGLSNQIQRASVSIMSNMAEGFERSTNKEFCRFLYMAKGSAGEVRSQLYIAKDLIYLDQQNVDNLTISLISISKQLSGLIKYLSRERPEMNENRNVLSEDADIYHSESDNLII